MSDDTKVKRDDGGPAFPRPVGYSPKTEQAGSGGLYSMSEPGMSLRDWFAGQALVGCVSQGLFVYDGEVHTGDLSKHCYALADAMIKERSKEE